MRNVFSDRNSHGPFFHFILSISWSYKSRVSELFARCSCRKASIITFSVTTNFLLHRIAPISLHWFMTSETTIKELKFINQPPLQFNLSEIKFYYKIYLINDVCFRKLSRWKGNISRCPLNSARAIFRFSTQTGVVSFRIRVTRAWRHKYSSIFPPDEHWR